MHRYILAFVAASVLAGTSGTVVLTAQKNKQTETEIRTTLRDDPADAIWSDGASYETDDALKTENVLTATDAANFILDTFTAQNGTPARCINLNLGSVVALTPGQFVPTPGCPGARLSSHSVFFDSSDSLRNMSADQFVAKRLAVSWDSGDTRYHLRFSGETVDLGDGRGPQDLAYVGFTCLASSSVGCTAWTAEPVRCDAIRSSPYSNFTNCTVNRLAVLERSSTKGTSTPVMVAVVDMPFAMNIVRR